MEMRQTMTRTEMIQLLIDQAGLPDYQAAFICDLLFDQIIDWLKEGNEVMLPKVGKFMFIKRDANKRKSNLMPRYQIMPHYQLKFRVGQHLARYVRVHTREHKK